MFPFHVQQDKHGLQCTAMPTESAEWKNKHAGIGTVPMLTKKLSKCVGVFVKVSQDILIVKMLQILEAANSSVVCNRDQWTKSHGINKKDDRLVRNIVRHCLFPQFNHLPDSAIVLKSAGNESMIACKPRIEKRFARKGKHSANSVKGRRRSSMHFLGSDEGIDGIPTSYGMASVVFDSRIKTTIRG
jgi:hypothetical protein